MLTSSPCTGPDWSRSSPLPCGTPSTTSTRTTSASSMSAMRTAQLAPTLPAPITVTFFRKTDSFNLGDYPPIITWRRSSAERTIGFRALRRHSFLRAPRRFLRGTSSQHRSVAFQPAMPPVVGAFFLRAAALRRPGDRPRHRTLRAVPFAACRYVEPAVLLAARGHWFPRKDLGFTWAAPSHIFGLKAGLL